MVDHKVVPQVVNAWKVGEHKYYNGYGLMNGGYIYSIHGGYKLTNITGGRYLVDDLLLVVDEQGWRNHHHFQGFPPTWRDRKMMGNRGNRAPASRRTGHAKWTKQGSFFLGTSANGTDSNAVCLRVATEPTEATGSRLGSQVGYQNRFFFSRLDSCFVARLQDIQVL